jgi:predicted HAD superfamily hydrolase
MPNIYSFDIFDTCLIRSCGEPRNVLIELAKEIIGENAEETLIRDFVRQRELAEIKAIEVLHKEAVTIDELYSFFDTSIYSEKKREHIKCREIEIERECLYPVKSAVEKIEQCRSKGRVLFISDMYLPDTVIKEILIKYGIYASGDGLYISGTIGLTKLSGNLFRYVKDKEKISYSKWLHHGDNVLSDYIKPRKLGIKIRRINHCYSSLEQRWISNVYLDNNWISNEFAGITRCIRLRNGIDEDDFVTNLMIPAFVPFVFCLLKKAQEEHIDRLYFASRDTYPIFLLAQRVSHLYPEIKLRYLHLSTKVIYPSCLRNCSEEEISNLLNLLDEFKPRKIFSMFGFCDKDINRLASRIDLDKNIPHEKKESFIRLLLEPENLEILRRHVEEKRQIFVRYLNQEKFLSEGNVALFDIGWRCTSQMMMRKIIDKDVHFYYYGVHKSRFPISDVGNYYSFTFFEDYDRLGAANFIEYYMCKTLEGSTIGYTDVDGTIEPVLEEFQSREEEYHDFQHNVELLEQTIELYSRIPSLVDNSHVIFKELSMKTLHQFAKNPPRRSVKFLSKRMYSDHFTDKKQMIIYLTPYKLFDILNSIRTKSHKYQTLWVEGSIINTFGFLGKKILKCDISSKVKEIGKVVVYLLKK